MTKRNHVALFTGVALAGATLLGAGTASAQGWMSIDQRQARLDDRIDAGVRSGDLSRREALSLRAEFRSLAGLEARYRTDGLSFRERQDLDRRFDQLSMRIRDNRRDGDRGWYGGRGWSDNTGRWVPVAQRQAQLDRRIDQGLRSGRLTRQEAQRLRADFNDLARMEVRFRAGGYSPREMAELDRGFDRLAMRIRFERRDDQRRYGMR
jgi:hypothetical protein